MERDVIVISEYNARNVCTILMKKYSIDYLERSRIYKDVIEKHPSMDLIKRRQEETQEI